MQTRIVQFEGAQVITPGRMPLAAVQLSALPLEIRQVPVKTSSGPVMVPVQVVPVVDTKS